MNKKAKFTLEPDGFSTHTIEFSREVSKTEYRRLVDELYRCNVGKKNAMYQDRSTGSYICTQFSDSGIRVRLESTKDYRFIRLVVNPRILTTGQNGYLGIFQNERENVDLLEQAFKSVLKDTPLENRMTRYYLSRVDLCTNIRCTDKTVFRELVRALRKTPTPKKYERRYFDHKDKKKANRYNKHLIRLSCGQQELVIYDKDHQIKENKLETDFEGLAERVLRIEVHLGRDKLRRIEKETGEEKSPELLWILMQQSRERILKLAEKCYPNLPYLHYEDGKELIKNSSFHFETKARMLRLFKLMRHRQTVDSALQVMEKENIKTDDLLKRFAKLGLNPIPLRKDFKVKSMPSLVHILKTLGDSTVEIDVDA